MRRLLERFPHCAAVSHVPAESPSAGVQSYAERVRTARSDTELVDAFLSHVRDGAGASAREAELIAEMLDRRTRVEATA